MVVQCRTDVAFFTRTLSAQPPTDNTIINNYATAYLTEDLQQNNMPRPFGIATRFLRAHRTSCRRLNTRVQKKTESAGTGRTLPTVAKELGISFVAGTLGSMLGIAGGVVMIPALTGTLAWTQAAAIGTTAVTNAVACITGAASYAHASSSTTPAPTPSSASSSPSTTSTDAMPLLPVALLIAVGASLTSPLGARLAARASPQTLSRIWGGSALFLFAPLIALKSVTKPQESVTTPSSAMAVVPALSALQTLSFQDLSDAAASTASFSFNDTSGSSGDVVDVVDAALERRAIMLPCVALGGVVGVVSGGLGVGAGIITTSALCLLTDLPYHTVVSTSLLACVLPHLVSAAAHCRLGNVVTRAAPALATGSAIGAKCGAEMATSVDEESMQLLLSLFLVVIGTRALLKRGDTKPLQRIVVNALKR
jgi:uncharacterized membrane protein YfcA